MKRKSIIFREWSFKICIFKKYLALLKFVNRYNEFLKKLFFVTEEFLTQNLKWSKIVRTIRINKIDEKTIYCFPIVLENWADGSK